MRKGNIWGLAGTAIGLGVGIAAERTIVKRRRRNDPEAGEAFGTLRGVRPRHLDRPDGARIFIEEAGPRSKSGIVFIHGSALRTDSWHYQLSGIGEHRLLFYDLRGHGLSRPKGDASYSIETLADDLEAVMDDARLTEVVLVGHSVGGMVALDYCVRNPDLLGRRIKGVVLLNTTYAPAPETLMGGAAVARIERVARRPLDFIGTHSERLERLRRIIKPSDAVFWTVSFAAFGPGASARHVDFTYDMLAETTADVIFDLIKAYRDFDVRDVLGDVTVPVLVVGGTADRITVCKASEYIAEHLPSSELVLLEGCGHMSMLERYREVNRLIERFATDHFRRPRRAARRESSA